MKILRNILTIGLISISVACSTQQPSKNFDKEYIEAKNILLKKVSPNERYAIGIGEPNIGNDIALQKKEATVNAQENLASQLEAEIESYYKKEKLINGKYTKISNEQIEVLIKKTLRGIRYVDEHRVNGIHFVLCTYDRKKFLEEMKLVEDDPNFLNAKNKKEVKEEEKTLD